MHIQLSGGRLGHRFDFETSGFQDKLVFEIGSLDVQELKGTVAVTFGFNDEDYYYLQINTPWQDESVRDALPLAEESLAQFDLTFWHQNELQNAGGNIDRISVADSGENWLFTVIHALPENPLLPTCRTCQDNRDRKQPSQSPSSRLYRNHRCTAE